MSLMSCIVPSLYCVLELSNAAGAQAPVFSELPRLPTLLGQFWHTLPLFRRDLLLVSCCYAKLGGSAGGPKHVLRRCHRIRLSCLPRFAGLAAF